MLLIGTATPHVEADTSIRMALENPEELQRSLDVHRDKHYDRHTRETDGELDSLAGRPFQERKAALNMIQLAKQTLGDDADRVTNLIKTLTVRIAPRAIS